MARDVLFVIGGGGREHALVWHLRRHHPQATLYCAPGNPGIAQHARTLAIPLADLDALAAAAADVGARMVVVGPEAPLVGGLADRLAARGIPVLGPTAAAAALEGSKSFAKTLMRGAGVPTAAGVVFDEPDRAAAYIRAQGGPLVVKADGLAAGKGVAVCDDAEEALAAVRAMMVERVFGPAGARVVIEDRLVGREVSVFALVDGEAVALLPAAQDHKRLGDGDRGPNTGGMGAAAPVLLPDDLRAQILDRILRPVASAMAAAGRPYRGVLFAGLMLTDAGPQVLEFNCRLGDPEAQVVLPLLDGSLVDAFRGLQGHGGVLPVRAQAAVGVVLASRGYPGTAEVGRPIEGLDAVAPDVLVFHGGTARRNGGLVTAGGRVLTVVGRGATMAAAREHTYAAVGAIRFDGAHYRRDIGAGLVEGAAASPRR